MHARASHLLLSLLMAWLAGSRVCAQPCGDCDGDARTTVLDALAVARHAVVVAPLLSPERESCDVQPAGGDGALGILDALELARVAVGLAPAAQCTLPAAMWRESFDEAAARDPALSTADWGETTPGVLRAARSIFEPDTLPVAPELSSLPLRDGGARLQMLWTAAELGGAAGALVAMELFVAQDLPGGRGYAGFEVRACHTNVDELSSVFQANYGGETPAIIHAPGDEVFGEAQAGQGLDVRVSPGAFHYDGVRNLLVEIIHHGASAPTPLAGKSRAAMRRVHASQPSASTGLRSGFSYRARLVFIGAFLPVCHAVSSFHDCGVPTPQIGELSLAAQTPAGTSLAFAFQGAPDDGAGQPYLPAASGWVDDDPSSLATFRHIRFRVEVRATPTQTPELFELRVPYDP